jgi:ferredoxin
MKVKVDPDLCTGCELCVGLCPEVFRMEDGKAVAASPAPAAHEAACKDAAAQCPTEAIKLEP